VTLRRLARDRHLAVGTAIGQPELGNDPGYLAVAAREYSSVTPENAMKWGLIHPERDRYDFADADATVAFAEAHHMMVRGHNLLWHNQNPSWLTTGTFTRDELIGILRDHIHTVVGHFRGRVRQWDVANEVVADDGLGLRDNLWLRGIGPDYLTLAFGFAHEADPDAQLYLNDYLTETVNPKSDFELALATLLRALGAPVDGIGIQMHRFLAIPESASDIRANLARISAARFQIWITEMDVAIQMPADANELAAQATVYGDVFRACLSVRRCRGITTWGYTDRYSWIPSFLPGFGAALPFDEALNPKPAYTAIRDALSV
jgi:endo-1,4-beta-xylanase